MASPIGNSPLVSSPQPVNPARSSAPGGVGSAPTTLQGQSPPAPEKGYIERAVIAVKDFIVWMVMKIFSCFKKEEPSSMPIAQQQVPEPALQEPIQDPRAQHRDLLARLPSIDRGEDILRYFHMYFPTVDERNFVLTEIGKAAGPWIRSYASVGQGMIQNNPKLLLSYLMARVSLAANH